MTFDDEPLPRADRFFAALAVIGRDTAALLWPRACVGCGVANRALCERCRAQLMRAETREIELHLAVPVWCVGTYSGVLRAIIRAYKHAEQREFAGVLGVCMGRALTSAFQYSHAGSGTVCVFAPARRRGVRKRGYHHVALVVRHAQRKKRQRVRVAHALRSLRGRTKQAGLGAADRERNAQLVAVRRGYRHALRGRDVVLVDDVITTGATVRAAQTVLEAAGARVVAVVALAYTPRKDEEAEARTEPVRTERSPSGIGGSSRSIL